MPWFLFKNKPLSD